MWGLLSLDLFFDLVLELVPSCCGVGCVEFPLFELLLLIGLMGGSNLCIQAHLVVYFKADSSYISKSVDTAQQKVGMWGGEAESKVSPECKGDKNLAGTTVLLSGRKFVCLCGFIKRACSHHNVIC